MTKRNALILYALTLLALASVAHVTAARTITATAGSFTGDGAGVTNINGGNIQTNTITATQIAANAITTSELNADAVTSAKIAAGTIVASDISAGSITADRLSVSSLSAISANLGTVTAGTINGVQINGSEFTAGSGNDVVRLSDSNATWRLWVGHATAGSAPFRVDKSGFVYADDGFVDNGWAVAGTLTVGSSGDLNLNKLAGAGRRYLCVENDGTITADTTAC